MERADRLIIVCCERLERRLHDRRFAAGRSAERLHNADRSVAGVANSTRCTRVVVVTEMFDQMDHPTALRLGKAGHLLRLNQPVCDLGFVGRGPSRVSAAE